ncbi:MAG TPA: radical SAM protein [Dehalococcoidia bacterium]|nr:radical SAM protein [Dehalococcoidia bacterium]
MGWNGAGKVGRGGSRHGLKHTGEQGAVVKDWGGRLPVAIIYPNSYYIGMSNLGIHAIYSLLNAYNDVVCERVFFGDKPVLSLESRRRLSDFAVLAFSVSYELDYFNVIGILRESGIPLYAADRDWRHPLVIAGGACITANPMPLAPFFDCLCIGEAEMVLPGLLPVLSASCGSRSEYLTALASLSGVYVPLYHKGNPVARQWLRNLDDFIASYAVLTRDTELGDMYLMEVERGCSWGCRFCLVGSAFCPIRYHSVDCLVERARLGLKYRKRLGLVGPVVSAHPGIEELLPRLRKLGAGLSVSSLRVSPLSNTVLDELAKGGVRTVTLAPEAGSHRLRRLIRKNISQDDILKATVAVAGRGMKQLKLYFMVGLPTETDEDIEEMTALVLECKKEMDKIRHGCRVSININPFVPKAGTPFQWLPMAELVELKRRMAAIKKALAPKGIAIRSDSLAWSQVQGALSRGNTDMAEVLAEMKEVSLAGWRAAVAKCRLDADYYILKQWDVNKSLPWSVIDLGVSPEHLAGELKKALA